MVNQDAAAGLEPHSTAVRNTEGAKKMAQGALAVALGQLGKRATREKLTESPTNLPLPVEPAPKRVAPAIQAGTNPT